MIVPHVEAQRSVFSSAQSIKANYIALSFLTFFIFILSNKAHPCKISPIILNLIL